jgi:hypothetical protein
MSPWLDVRVGQCCTAIIADALGSVVLAYKKDIVEAILQSSDGEARRVFYGKVSNYIGLLASTGKTEEQLLVLGKAYLNEILNPDPRYTGC